MSQRFPLRNLTLNQDIFANLPSEIVIDILSRLPVRTIISCKCVCKSWFDLVDTHEFAKSHLSRSFPGLVVFKFRSQSYEIIEFEDRELQYNPVTRFDLPFRGRLRSSANGLLFLSDMSPRTNVVYICNPITRDYIQIHFPQEYVCSNAHIVGYGFGASKIMGQYKVVLFFHDCMYDEETDELVRILKSECQIYTLGTGLWRRIAPSAPLRLVGHATGAFLNGSLHWLVFDLNGSTWISCFDLETEHFSTLSSPPPLVGRKKSLAALGNCLCLCDFAYQNEIVFWVMKEYGVEKSWTKEFAISQFRGFAFLVHPINVLEDGDTLVAWRGSSLVSTSKKNKTIQKNNMFEPGYGKAIVHSPSFLSLKSYGKENVRLF